jgi:hypothetical protein
MPLFGRLRLLLQSPIEAALRLTTVIESLESQSRMLERKLTDLVEGTTNQQALLNDKLAAVVARLDKLEAGIAHQQAALESRLDQQARILVEGLANQQGATRRGAELLSDKLDALIAALNDQSRVPGARLETAQRALDDGTWRGRRLRVCHQAHEHDRIYAENMAEYLGGIGAPCKLLEFAAPGDLPQLHQCLDDDTVAILGINSQLDHCWLATESFVDAAAKRNLPVIHWIMDHPSARWMEFNHATAPNVRFLLTSDYCERYFRRYARPGARTAATSGVGPNRRSRADHFSRPSYLRRQVSCLIPVNLKRLGGSREELETRIGQLGPAPQTAVRTAIGRARRDLTGPLEEHLEWALAQAGFELPSPTFHACAHIIEDVTQSERRLRIFETAASFPVRIQTDAPPARLTEAAVATFHTDSQSTSAIATMELMQSCRAVLSVSLTNDMLHDRVANALNAGCLAIVEDNAIHRRLFEDGKNALFFRYDDDSLARCLDLVCNQPERACEIAQSGFAMRDDPMIRFGNFHRILELA